MLIMSAYGTDAQTFFEGLRSSGARLLLDVRLRNTSQLCGFTKRDDLAWLVPALCGAEYAWAPLFAPTPELLDAYLHHRIGWEEYAKRYEELMVAREAREAFRAEYGDPSGVALLGTATHNRRSHAEVLGTLLEKED